MILPVVKLGTLALKTLCKPIASRLKIEAGKHPKFRQLIINFAQANHRFQTTMQRRIYGHATDVEIRPLNEDKAVQAAADLLGELFVFSVVLIPESLLFLFCVAGAAVIFEVQRSSRSEARKEEIRRQELEDDLAEVEELMQAQCSHQLSIPICNLAMKQRDDDLAREVELLKHKLEELEHLAKGRGLSGIFNFRHAHATEDGKSANPA
ncbi:hypothetical protein HHK36_005246 [Tetracentron sinense]|uniref:Optic atrophy 3 protein n=1 Tax=Tetracentron sinense TaxID=13715 RepID=A0A835DQW9_TETSI|nr:hypothetical protein HHK36_005246 [Tetracentron sinense]